MTRSLVGQTVEVRTLIPIAGDFVHKGLVLTEAGKGLQAILGVVIINSTGVHYRSNVRHLTAGGDFSSVQWAYPINRDLAA
jgi:hypothetical protein